MNLDKIDYTKEFVDTGEAWEQKKIIKYRGSPTRRDDFDYKWLPFDSAVAHFRMRNSNPQKFYDILIEDGDILMKLAPYLCESGTWEYLLRDITLLLESDIENKKRIEEIAMNVEGKMKIMKTREEYLENIESACEKHELASVSGGDWTDEQIEEYRKNEFLKDYTVILRLHLKLKNILEGAEVTSDGIKKIYKLTEGLYDRIIKMPVHALDNTFKWSTLASELENLSEDLEGKEKELILSLSGIIKGKHAFLVKQKKSF